MQQQVDSQRSTRHLECTRPEHLPMVGSLVASPHVTLAHTRSGQPDFDSLTARLPMVSMLLAFQAHTAWEAVESDRLQRRRFRNRLHFLPPDVAITARIEGTVPELLTLAIDAEFARATMAGLLDGRAFEERVVIGNAPAPLLGLGNFIRNRIVTGARPGRLELESIATLWLQEWAEASTIVVDHRSAGSSLRSLPEVQAYIRAHLDQDLSLTQLAEVARLSPSHFIRAFKQATGQTPLRYLTVCRLEQARQLLAETDRPIATIAYACGFASQSHMTDVFRRHLSTTPARYRQSS
jgi:AraC family transcriptional regulator